jgi:fibrillarin-like pre-rRNA processing protein
MRIDGLFLMAKKHLATLNLIKGNTVYDEKLITIDKEEYRLWDIFRSKLAAALVKGLKNLPIKKQNKSPLFRCIYRNYRKPHF